MLCCFLSKNSLIRDAIAMHHGKCRIPGKCVFWGGTNGYDISASAASILTIIFSQHGPVKQATTLVQTEISQQLLDGLP